MFGSIRQRSRIAVDSLPIVNPKHETAQFAIPVQRLKIGTENCTSMSYDERPIQNFKHHYFSGEFYFEIDVTKCRINYYRIINWVEFLTCIHGFY